MLLRGGAHFENLEPALRQMVEAAQKPQRLAVDAAMNHLERFLIEADEIKPEHAAAPVDASLGKALVLIGERLAELLNCATSVGFPDAFYFSTRFHRHFGLAPAAYRARMSRRLE